MFVKPGWELSFKLPADKLPKRKAYLMSVRFVTVHERSVDPFLVSIADATGSNVREYELAFEMKWQNLGKWQNTEDVVVELGGTDETLKLTRKEPKHACTLKDIRFTLLK